MLPCGYLAQNGTKGKAAKQWHLREIIFSSFLKVEHTKNSYCRTVSLSGCNNKINESIYGIVRILTLIVHIITTYHYILYITTSFKLSSDLALTLKSQIFCNLFFNLRKYLLQPEIKFDISSSLRLIWWITKMSWSYKETKSFIFLSAQYLSICVHFLFFFGLFQLPRGMSHSLAAQCSPAGRCLCLSFGQVT